MNSEGLFANLARRPWSSEEQELVRRGFAGRILIAIEPLLGTIVLMLLTVLPFYAHPVHDMVMPNAAPARFSLAQVLAPIMAFGAIGFAIYTIALMWRPTRALLSTRAPIFIVDGYLQYTTTQHAAGRRGMVVEILTHSREVVQEWKFTHPLAVNDGTYPALVEFSRYGGILKIDGRHIAPPLGSLAPFGIGTFSHVHRSSDLS